MCRILPALLLALGLAGLSGPALGAVCTPTPALPDTERRTEYAGIVAQTGPFNVGFQLYGDSTDYGNWISVWVNGVALTPVTDFTVDSPTGALAGLCRPISDARVTFTVAQTGTIEIEGSQRPRRTSQVSENAGVTARTFNQVISTLTAELRERWDRQSRLMRSPPGESLNVLPPAATRASQAPCFDTLGQLTLCPTITGMPIPAGIDTNALATGAFITSPPTVDNSFCGKTVILGGAAFFTFTVGPASGFNATCSIVVANLDSGRGKRMAISGVTFPNNSILWPLQSFTLKNENGGWAIFNRPGRWKLTGSVVFNVDSGAADNSADGLATGTANAFKTINGAITVMAQSIDANMQAVSLTPKCAGGPPVTYSENITLLPIVGASVGGGLGSANITLNGDTTTPANCIINGPGAPSTILAIGNGNDWIIQGFQLKNASAACIIVDAHGWLRAGVMDFNSCGGAGANHLVLENGSTYEPMASYTISAGAASHVLTTLGGAYLFGTGTITLTGTPAFPNGFAFSNLNSYQSWVGASFSGSATGPRYNVSLGGGINTNGGGASFLPGNSVGVPANPGWYN